MRRAGREGVWRLGLVPSDPPRPTWGSAWASLGCRWRLHERLQGKQPWSLRGRLGCSRARGAPRQGRRSPQGPGCVRLV